MRQSRRTMTIANSKIDERSFNFTGRYNFHDEGDGQWNLEFLESGTLTFNRSANVDVWCVGGGGGGAPSASVANNNSAGGGGGGGYTEMGTGLRVVAGTAYPVVVGNGGERGYYTPGWNAIITGKDGAPSSFMGIIANGGQGGATTDSTNSSLRQRGGNGGSGGGGTGSMQDGVIDSSGGSDGSNGYGTKPGIGAGLMTRDFRQLNGTLRAGGGGGGNYFFWNYDDNQGKGGAGGGGDARHAEWSQGGTLIVNAYDGEPNTGGGGGGASTYYNNSDSYYANGGNGGSGIVIIRSHRVANSLKYTYSGDADYTQEDDYNWYVDITSGGTLTITEEATVDIYLLGGGQSGYIGSHWGDSTDYYAGGAGGQGGYTNILHGVTLQPGTYTLTIGQGGVGGQDRNGIAGGSTIFGGIDNGTAPGGGSGAPAPEGGTIKAGAAGGIAGSGNSSWTPHGGGDGANSTVYDFTGINRGGGGGGGYSAKDTHSSGSGGSTSGGNMSSTGGSSGASYNDGGYGGAQGGGGHGHSEATPNYGGGGVGGGGAYYRETKSGSSGFIQIRNAR